MTFSPPTPASAIGAADTTAKLASRRYPARGRRALRLSLIAACIVVFAILAWASFAPIPAMSREAVYEIPAGTWAQRMAGNPIEILPDEIRLTLGLQDILILKNLDDVPQMFGPTLMMPGQSLRLPFSRVSSTQFACTAHASGQMTITVEPFPASPWLRLRWRALQWRASAFNPKPNLPNATI